MKGYLEQGLSLIQIGALENRDPSTVGYWVRKYGLEANGRDRYAPRGGIERELLEALIRRELTIQLAPTSRPENRAWPRSESARAGCARSRQEAVSRDLSPAWRNGFPRLRQWAVAVRSVQLGGRSSPAPVRETAAHQGIRRTVRGVWLCQVPGCPAVPSPGSKPEGVRCFRTRRDTGNRQGPGRGQEVRSPLRQLPCRG